MTRMNVKGIDLIDGMIEPDFDEDLGRVTARNITQKMVEIAQALKVALCENPNLQVTLKVCVPKPGIAAIIMGTIHDNNLHKISGKKEMMKGYEMVLIAIKKHYPKAKFELPMFFWYLERYRRQLHTSLRIQDVLKK